jgi:transcriptional regulator with XRE-family HTH domain
VSGDSQVRRELARFLRNRRERISPEQVGFPVGPRRRSPGLRREEVAVLAGLSPTWYTYLEQGRDIQPSPEVLDSLARVLGLTEDERRYMHTLAYGHVIRPVALDAGVPVEELLRQIVAASAQSPYPVYASNVYCDLIAWNQAATEWYDDWGRLSAGERNMLRWMLIEPKARERIADWEADTQDVVARWRAEIARRPTDRRLQGLIAEFSRVSPEFVRWWKDHDVVEHRARIRHFQHPLRGIQAMRLVPVQSPHLPSSGIIFHLPVDGQLDQPNQHRPME